MNQKIPLNSEEIRNTPHTPYEIARNEIRTGDLMLCSGDEAVSRIIQRATRSPYSHVAMVVRMLSIDRVLLLEAEWPYGVRAVPLSSYFKDWNGSGNPYPGQLMVVRHEKFDVNEEASSMFLSELVDNLGRRYSIKRALRMGVRELAALAGFRFRELQLKKATVCSEYVYHAYSRLGIQLPWNSKGYILPMDIACHPDISLVCRIL